MKFKKFFSTLLSALTVFSVSSFSGIFANEIDDAELLYTKITEFLSNNTYTSEDIVKDTNISISFHNLIRNVKIEETTKDIITCLAVRGSGDFTISEVNPLGTSNIYDFSYYLNEQWMQKSLIDAIKKWDRKVKDSEKTYSENFSKLRDLNAELLKLQGELATLQNNLKAQEQIRSAQMPNISKSVVNKINTLNKEISAKQKEIDSKNKEISKAQKTLQDINTSLKFANNFTKKAAFRA